MRRSVSARLIRPVYLTAILLALPFLLWNGLVQQFNADASDVLLRLRGAIHSRAANGILLLLIDDSTLREYGPLPIRRSVLARAIQSVAEFRPRALVIDMLLSEPGPAGEDQALANALSMIPSTVLGAALESDQREKSRWIAPIPVLADSRLIGHVHADPDADGNVRSVLLAKASEGKRFWALSVQAARAALHLPPAVEEHDALQLGNMRIPAVERNDRMLRINYAGPEGTFRRISLSGVLNRDVRQEDFRDKIVLLGVSAQGGGDRLFTPVSTGIGMSGVEIHANILRTILDQDFLTPLSPPAEIGGGVLITFACIAVLSILHGAPVFVALSGIAFAIPALSAIALRYGSVWPVASFLMVFAVAAGAVGAGEYAAIWLNLRSSERKRQEYAFRVQAIAHEIKTPLTAIQGSSEIISDQLVPEAERQRIAGMIHKESKRLTDIIHTFLDVERIASGSLHIQKRPVELRQLCEDVLERARLYAARKEIRIDSMLPAVSFPGDPDLLSFAVYNLLTNAVKYSPKRTNVTLMAAAQGDNLCISVADQGYGIAPDEQSKIFERFYRARRGNSVHEEGAGIGLALVKEIVVQHDGRIEVESHEGRGSRFTIVLPAKG